jgi:hypothetical protein
MFNVVERRQEFQQKQTDLGATSECGEPFTREILMRFLAARHGEDQ